MKQIASLKFSIIVALLLQCLYAHAQKDTLRVMAYNVLYYGNGCQGPNGYYHNHLKTITRYTNPDILSLEKAASIPTTPGDKYATAPEGFADSILAFALNAAFPGRYACCPFTNNAKANNQCLLFYNTAKLGFAGIVSSYVNLTDFNTYKLYYKDPALATTHDTTFIYLVLNHDKSGDEFEAVRGMQIAGTMQQLKKHFTGLPNVISLGDFNARNSDEIFYKALTATTDSAFRFYDPPFFPDKVLSYPADWDHNGKYTAYFTTSTRASGDIPNSCGSGGGAKNWYDHIFISSWIANNTNYVRYIPSSYTTVGNDGQRYKVAINNSNMHANSSAPADLINALYRMSNKYPVMIALEVTSNLKGTSITDPEIAANILAREDITITDPVMENMLIHIPAGVSGEITMECIDAAGTVRWEKKIKIKENEISLRCTLEPGKIPGTILSTAQRCIGSKHYKTVT